MHILNNMAIEKAWIDTISFWDWKRSLFIPVLFGIGWVLHKLWAEPNSPEPKGEIMLWLTYTLAPVLIFTVGLFIYNLFCAPYRLEQEDHAATKARLAGLQQELSKISPSGLKSFINSRSRFTLREASYILASEPITSGEVTGTAAGYLRDLEKGAFNNKLVTVQPVPEIHKALFRASAVDRFNNLLKGPMVPSMPEVEVTKEELIRFAGEKYGNLPEPLL